MKPFFLLFLLGAVLLLSRCQTAPQQTEQPPMQLLKVGAASAPVNPPVGAFIAGDKQNRRFTGVHDSLFVKAVVVHDGTKSLAILTVDCIGLLYPAIRQIQEQAAALVQNIALPADHIIVSSTHTHSGPDVVGIWGPDLQHSGVDSAYLRRLVRTAAEQVQRAAQNLQEVTVRVGETQFGEEWVQNIADKEIDRSVTVMQFVNRQGQPVASLTNFACHPTYLDAKHTVVSADYVGGFYRELKRQWGGENLFLQGAIGGWVQPVDGEGTVEKADLRGRELAQAAVRALQQPDTLSDHTLQLRSKKIRFLVENEGWKQLSAIGTIDRPIQDSVDTEVVWFAIGPAQFATHPGETAPYYGLQTKQLMKTGPRFVLGLSMDALGYILKPAFFENPELPHAGYLTSMSVGRQTGPKLMRTLEELVPQ